MPPPKNAPRRLAVEGTDDKWSIVNLLAQHGTDWDRNPGLPFVHVHEGVSRLLTELPTALKSLERFGVVLDADDDLGRRWAQLIDRAKEADIGLPPAPAPDGTVVHLPDGRRFGVWLMPDNTLPGKLEDFLKHLVPVGDPVWEHAGTATTDAIGRRATLRQVDHIKGQLHAWLAWQEQPGVPFGTALTNRTLRHDAEIAGRFVAWFWRVFGDVPSPITFA